MAGREMNPKLKLDRIHGDMLEFCDMEFIRVQDIDWIGIDSPKIDWKLCPARYECGFTIKEVVIRATINGRKNVLSLGVYDPLDYLTDDQIGFLESAIHAPYYFYPSTERPKVTSLVSGSETAAKKEAQDDLLAFITAISNKGVPITC